MENYFSEVKKIAMTLGAIFLFCLSCISAFMVVIFLPLLYLDISSHSIFIKVPLVILYVWITISLIVPFLSYIAKNLSPFFGDPNNSYY